MRKFTEFIAEHIVKLGNGKYRLLSHKGKNLGTFGSHAAAAKHEGEVEYFKAHEETDGVPAGVVEGNKPKLPRAPMPPPQKSFKTRRNELDRKMKHKGKRFDEAADYKNAPFIMCPECEQTFKGSSSTPGRVPQHRFTDHTCSGSGSVLTMNTCPKCKGTKYVRRKEGGQELCPTCDGKRFVYESVIREGNPGPMPANWQAGFTSGDLRIGGGGHEVPVIRNGRWQLYVWDRKTGKHHWYDYGTDTLLDEDAIEDTPSATVPPREDDDKQDAEKKSVPSFGEFTEEHEITASKLGLKPIKGKNQNFAYPESISYGGRAWKRQMSGGERWAEGKLSGMTYSDNYGNILKVMNEADITVTIAGKTYVIPSMWLSGRTRMLEKQGMSPKDAYREAIDDWVDQVNMSEAAEDDERDAFEAGRKAAIDGKARDVRQSSHWLRGYDYEKIESAKFPRKKVVNGVTLYRVVDRNGKYVYVSVPEEQTRRVTAFTQFVAEDTDDDDIAEEIKKCEYCGRELEDDKYAPYCCAICAIDAENE